MGCAHIGHWSVGSTALLPCGLSTSPVTEKSARGLLVPLPGRWAGMAARGEEYVVPKFHPPMAWPTEPRQRGRGNQGRNWDSLSLLRADCIFAIYPTICTILLLEDPSILHWNGMVCETLNFRFYGSNGVGGNEFKVHQTKHGWKWYSSFEFCFIRMVLSFIAV